MAPLVGPVFRLVAAPEFQATVASRQLLAARALAAGVRAILQATPEAARVDLDVHAAGEARVEVFRRPVP